MKKLTVLLAMTMLLAACGGNSEPEKKGNGESAKDKNGDNETAEITVQVEFLENYIEKNGLDKVEMNDAGYPVNDDVLAGCTINVKNLMDAAKNAKDNAK